MLITIEQVLDADALQHIHQQLQGADWQDGAATAGTLARSVKRNQQLADDSATARTLGEAIVQRLSGHPLFVSAALPARIYPPKFNRYADGGHYGAHVDSALMRLPARDGAGSGPMHNDVMRNDLMRSDLSATLFLAEPDSYDGGELEIDDSYGSHSVKLAAGDLVLYPSGSLHRVRPVTHGTRVAAFFWIESLVADDGQRRQLFELDQAIQGLQTSAPALAPDDARLLQLTSVYHNLLRRWARP
jgi:PKHD-type hydroxylase